MQLGERVGGGSAWKHVPEGPQLHAISQQRSCLIGLGLLDDLVEYAVGNVDTFDSQFCPLDPYGEILQDNK